MKDSHSLLNKCFIYNLARAVLCTNKFMTILLLIQDDIW